MIFAAFNSWLLTQWINCSFYNFLCNICYVFVTYLLHLCYTCNIFGLLTFLIDEIVSTEFVCYFVDSIHLFFMFPRLEEGGLATYRAALVQNQHLTVLAEVMSSFLLSSTCTVSSNEVCFSNVITTCHCQQARSSVSLTVSLSQQLILSSQFLLYVVLIVRYSSALYIFMVKKLSSLEPSVTLIVNTADATVQRVNW